MKNSCVRETDTNDLNFCRIFICEGHRKASGDRRDEKGGIDGVLPWFLNRTQCRLGSAEDGGKALVALLCLCHSCFVLPIPYIVLLVKTFFFAYQFSSVAQSCLTLRPHESQHARPPCPSPTPEFTQAHVHQVSDAIQPSHPLSSPSPPAPNPSQHQSLFQ